MTVRAVRLMTLLLLGFGAQVATANDTAREYLELKSAHDADCLIFKGKMRQLDSTHTDRAIEAYLYRYMGETQQPGRRVEVIQPDGKPLDLGCTRTADGLSQEWNIIKADFRQ